MATLTVQNIVITGLEASYVAAAGGGDEFANDGRTFFQAINGSGGDITLTFTTPKTIGGVAISDPTVVVTAGEERMVGPFDPAIFNAADGNVDVGYSGVTSLTVAAIKLP